MSNRLVRETILADRISDLAGYRNVTSEVRYGIRNSRIDFYLSDHKRELPDCYVEVKNVSLKVQDGVGLFPDAVTVRGQKHLEELIFARKQGFRAVLVFCVQHTGIERIMPADQIDPVYGDLLRKAVSEGVEVMA
ncbi:MAG TPA: DNA/RNA nuclease SfsA, partial [Gammaproteobacteria bacterium]|nr:DNA/RNA nuclease SfsA [Gammaproteobacteria bacterium]